jgi:hypothetical protein
VQGVSGDPYDRTGDEYHRAARQQVSGPPVDAKLVYRLATSVPDNWIPFVPVAADGSSGVNPVVQLQRRVLVRTEDDVREPPFILAACYCDPIPVSPRKVSRRCASKRGGAAREGVVVTRTFQFGRWFDGRSLIWVGRRKRPGRGEGSSGLRFDVTERA